MEVFKMNKSEIKELNNESLLSEFYWNAVRVTKEANSARGVTNKAQKEEEWIRDEIIKRFELDEESFREMVDK
jgi:hypothetical protein